MRAAALTVAFAIVLVFSPHLARAAGGQVTLKGSMVCGKCVLNETKECQNVLLVGEKGKETKYYLTQNKVSKDKHDEVCSGPVGATVKGTVKESKGKKILTATQITYEGQ